MQDYRRILVPTDGSEDVRPAVRKAVSLAALVEAEVRGLYVIDSAGFSALPGDFEWETLREAFQEQARSALAFVEETARAAGVSVETATREGHPTEEIVAAAAEWPADLVVMGTLGRSGLAHLLLGSVAERVMRHAPCPVMVVRARKG